jgi:hypothetical protein
MPENAIGIDDEHGPALEPKLFDMCAVGIAKVHIEIGGGHLASWWSGWSAQRIAICRLR